MRRILLALFVLALAVPFAACTGTTVNPRGFAPASLADVDQVREEVATDRVATSKAFAAVHDDLSAAKIDTTNLAKAEGDLKAHADEIASRPPPSGIGGALLSALGASGVLPNWADWLLSLGAPLLGLNYVRNKTRKKALAKVAPAAPKPPAAV